MFSGIKEYVVELAKDFYLITAPNKSRFPFCNSFLFTGKENFLIDAGMDKQTLFEIDRSCHIDSILFSHSHPDHILNWRHLSDRKIYLPNETPDAIYDLETLGLRFMGSVENGKYWAKVIGEGLDIKPFRRPDFRFKDSDILEIGEFRLQMIHAPGHLADHYCFMELTTETLLTSDIDFSAFGPFYGQPECDIELFIKSIKKVMSFPYKQLCSSHKLPVKGDATEKFEMFMQGFERHKGEILKICKTPQTLDQIVENSPIYRGRMPDKILQDTFERGMVEKSIVQMLKENVIKETESGYMDNRKN